MIVPHEKMLTLFNNAGASVDQTEGRVRIPSELIDECLGQAGKKFTIYGRDRSKTAAFGYGTRNYNSSAGQASWIDKGSNRRYATFDDVITATKLGDVLPCLNIVGPMADPHEMPPAYRCVEVAAAMLKHTDKPITFWFHDRSSAKFVVELFTAIAGSPEELAKFPFAYPFFEPISPLRFPKDGIDLLFETAKVPLPVPVGPMAQTGMSAPGTLAGTIAQETAEILGGICVTQLIRPGMPVCFGGVPHTFDMRTTQCIFGGPEQGLMAAAMTEMGKHYGLPVYVNVGLTDSKCVDAQTGLEVAASLMMGVLAGADIFGHLGICGADQGGCLETLVFQHETIEYIERIARSITVNNEKLGLDIIDNVGPGGTFIDQMHTAKHFRSELWMPGLLDRQFWSAWEQDGRKHLSSKLPNKVDELLASYVEKPLEDSVANDVENILKSARKHLG
jgi:trimethylamine--corrinoid protein Co-methyltransferase